MAERPKFSGIPVLLVALALLSLASPLVKWLVQHGGDTGLVSPGAISFCNVLFMGNLCAGLTTLAFFGPKRITRELRQTQAGQWWLVAANVGLAIAIPTLLFSALQYTTVANLILLGRVESVAFTLFAWIFYRSLLDRAQIAGYAIIVMGIITLVLIEGMGMIGRGEVYVFMAASLQGLGAVASKRLCERMSVPAFVFLRNIVSAVVFFMIALVLYGPHHFAAAFGPGLWLVMLVYGLGVVVLSQIAWYCSLAVLAPSTVASWSMMSPALAILFAYLLLRELPGTAQIIGGVVIAAGMVVARLGARKPPPEMGEGRLAAQ